MENSIKRAKESMYSISAQKADTNREDNDPRNEIEWCKEATYLRITMDKKLTWKKHQENAIKKTKAAMAQLYLSSTRKGGNRSILVYTERTDLQRFVMGPHPGIHEKKAKKMFEAIEEHKNEELRELTNYDPEEETSIVQRRHRRPKTQYRTDA
ncbi:hypothetical protein WA026_021495 [Henosepilachna vigintioctopunctata]|uniref:Uncharacterized protein n=1 Tax=Henosepilachna vigintioctopunctata TaxID=420089 RepID=A0AAW1UFS6_9CUCU